MPDRLVHDRRTPYVETFDTGPGGWFAWRPARHMPSPLEECSIPPEIESGALISRSPWWVDSNHAPPGAGYLHLLAFLLTSPHDVPAHGRPNHFTDGGYSRDLRNARLTVRIRGEVDWRGAELVLLVQSRLPTTTANYVLTGQPFSVTPEWSEQTVTLSTDADQWTCLGARWDLLDYYGCADIDDVLADVNVDLILVLFPVEVVAAGPVADLHATRPHLDYELRWDRLASGRIELDTIRIDYPLVPTA
jgi:hypothetical protein